MSEEESVAKYSWWMYWRYVWRDRVKAKFFNPYRAIPSVVTFVLVFIWKHNANKTPFTEMWVTVAVTVGVYLGLYWLNVLWSFVVLTPPKIYGEQIEVIQDGIGRLSALEHQQEVTPAFEATVHSERPWLLVSMEDGIYSIQPPVLIERLAGTLGILRSGCKVEVKNSGRSPARIVEAKLLLTITTDAVHPNISKYEPDGAAKIDYIFPPNTSIPVSAVADWGDGKLTPEEKRGIEVSASSFLWFVGYLKYVDTFKRPNPPVYETRFCYRWMPVSYLVKNPFWQMDGPPEYNRAT